MDKCLDIKKRKRKGKVAQVNKKVYVYNRRKI